jgi:hypothetical protein
MANCCPGCGAAFLQPCRLLRVAPLSTLAACVTHAADTFPHPATQDNLRYEGEILTDKLIKLRSTRQDLEAELFLA